jgi:hypothetical protein
MQSRHPERMRFVPYADAASVPHVIVDGAPTAGTVLTLSHWPKSGTPAALRADTSAEIVFNYLDRPDVHVEAEGVSNNHFDEDGLIGIFALLQPALASRFRALLRDVARVGDFGVYRSRNGARIACMLAAYANPKTSPLPRSTFSGAYPQVAASLYRELLPVLPHLITHVEDYQALWESDDRALSEGEAWLDGGIVSVEPKPDLDLAIVRVPLDVPVPHEMALNTRTPYSRLIVVRGQSIELRYRYEGWVQFTSRPVAPRVDLGPLAAQLNADETHGRWVFDGVDEITPRLHLDGGAATSIPADAVVARMEEALRSGQPAWNPYD